jgi:3-hydroxybutyryl-CoA dehydrogenase
LVADAAVCFQRSAVSHQRTGRGVSKVAVVGAGTMGNGIAHVFAQAGWDVSLVDVSKDQLERGLATIKKNLERMEKKGAVSKEQGAETLGRIQSSSSLDAVKDAELVLEAATENPDVKFDIFEQLDHLTLRGTILASNTSSISITEIAKQTNRPERVIGMHFMNPVPVMPLVEIVKGRRTGDGIVERTVEISRQLGKTPVVVNDSPGFVSNRVLMPMINEAIFCVQDGVASAEAVDQVMKLGMNHPIGPLALADLIGLDVCLAILEVLEQGFEDKKYRAAPLLRSMVEAGKLGRKSGQGFYAYRD